jgi:hypothetical protein
MYETFANLIKDHLGLAFLIGLLCVGGFIFLIWWTCSMYHKMKNIEKLPCSAHSDKLDVLSSISEKINNLPCQDHKLKIEKQIDKHGSIESSISSINTSITYMQKSIDSLTQSLQRNKGIITDPFTQTRSPLSITPNGYVMIQKLGVNEMFENNWSRIKLLIEENTLSKNPYDIQQFCLEQAVVFPEKFLKDEELVKIKMDAYTTGSSLTSYMKVIAVMARDRYFEENGINVTDVDIYDPNIPSG